MQREPVSMTDFLYYIAIVTKTISLWPLIGHTEHFAFPPLMQYCDRPTGYHELQVYS
jgi:hypothetical protein